MSTGASFSTPGTARKGTFSGHCSDTCPRSLPSLSFFRNLTIWVHFGPIFWDPFLINLTIAKYTKKRLFEHGSRWTQHSTCSPVGLVRGEPMEPHGAPWGPMGPHGALWGPMGPLWAHGAAAGMPKAVCTCLMGPLTPRSWLAGCWSGWWAGGLAGWFVD